MSLFLIKSYLILSDCMICHQDFGGDGPLRGVEWQRVMEKRASVMGGGADTLTLSCLFYSHVI